MQQPKTPLHTDALLMRALMHPRWEVCKQAARGVGGERLRAEANSLEAQEGGMSGFRTPIECRVTTDPPGTLRFAEGKRGFAVCVFSNSLATEGGLI